MKVDEARQVLYGCLAFEPRCLPERGPQHEKIVLELAVAR